MEDSGPEIGRNMTEAKDRNMTEAEDRNLTEAEIKAYLEQLNWTSFQAEVPFFGLMALFFVVGVTGNSLTLYLYLTCLSKNSASPLYVTMAVYSLLTSGVCVPLDMYNSMWRNLNHNNVPFCQLYRFFVNTVFVASDCLLLLMAIDCYLKICHPWRFVDLKAKQISCLMTGVTSVVVHIPIAYLVFGLTKVKTDEDGVFGHRCLIQETARAMRINELYHYLLGVLFAITLITLIVCYGLVFRKWRQLKLYKTKNPSQFSPSDIQKVSKSSGEESRFISFSPLKWSTISTVVRIQHFTNVLAKQKLEVRTAQSSVDQPQLKPLPRLQLEIEQVEAGPSQAGTLALGLNSNQGSKDVGQEAKKDVDSNSKVVTFLEQNVQSVVDLTTENKFVQSVVDLTTENKFSEEIKANDLISSKLTISKNPHVKDLDEVGFRATPSFTDIKQETLQTNKKISYENSEAGMSNDHKMVRTARLYEICVGLIGNAYENYEKNNHDLTIRPMKQDDPNNKPYVMRPVKTGQMTKFKSLSIKSTESESGYPVSPNGSTKSIDSFCTTNKNRFLGIVWPATSTEQVLSKSDLKSNMDHAVKAASQVTVENNPTGALHKVSKQSSCTDLKDLLASYSQTKTANTSVVPPVFLSPSWSMADLSSKSVSSLRALDKISVISSGTDRKDLLAPDNQTKALTVRQKGCKMDETAEIESNTSTVNTSVVPPLFLSPSRNKADPLNVYSPDVCSELSKALSDSAPSMELGRTLCEDTPKSELDKTRCEYIPSSKTTAISFMVVSITFFVSYAFTAAVLQADAEGNKRVQIPPVRVFAFKLSYLNNCLSPLVYMYFNLRFRMEVTRVIKSLKEHCVRRCA